MCIRDSTIAIQLNNHNPLTSLRLDFSINIDEAGAPDKVIVPAGSTVSYLPGLMEPGSEIYEPAIFENDQIENENSDWIEIYNSGSSTVDLSNWPLSDSENVPDKWKFPQGTVISPDQYLSLIHI